MRRSRRRRLAPREPWTAHGWCWVGCWRTARAVLEPWPHRPQAAFCVLTGPAACPVAYWGRISCTARSLWGLVHFRATFSSFQLMNFVFERCKEWKSPYKPRRVWKGAPTRIFLAVFSPWLSLAHGVSTAVTRRPLIPVFVTYEYWAWSALLHFKARAIFCYTTSLGWFFRAQ